MAKEKKATIEKKPRKKRKDAKPEGAIIGWTPRNKMLLKSCQDVLDDLYQYLPLTVRQVYYQLVSKLIIPNKLSAYKVVGAILGQARYDGLIPWESIEDNSRDTSGSEGYLDVADFIDVEQELFLYGYSRNLMQSQDVYIEVWVEKDALVDILKQATSPYCIRTLACRGFDSHTCVHKYEQRIQQAQKDGKRIVLLYFGDLDPSGMAMLADLKNRIENRLGVHGVTYKRVGLSLELVRELNLPIDYNGVKDGDPRAPKYIEQYGRLVVELDAVPPAVLQQLCRDAIEEEIDLELLEHERMLEQQDIERIATLRERALSQLQLN